MRAWSDLDVNVRMVRDPHGCIISCGEGRDLSDLRGQGMVVFVPAEPKFMLSL